jgi:hypothetical protein
MILGADHQPVLDALNKLFGGVLLGGAALGAGVGWLGLIDPKGEANQIVRPLLAKLNEKWLGAGGLRRYQLITAAHSTVVASAFFEELRQEIGPKAYGKLSLTKEERLARFTGAAPDPRATALERLLETDIPMPYVGCGFVENLPNIERYLQGVAASTLWFLRGLKAWEPHAIRWFDERSFAPVVARAVERYKEDYHTLAVRVPEFRMWTQLGEHHATRAALDAVASDLLSAVRRMDQTLAALHGTKIESSAPAERRPQREILAGLNRAPLAQPVISREPLDHVDDLAFPTLAGCYVPPHFRMAIADGESEPAHDSWWESSASQREDLLRVLAAHLCSPASTRLPAVVFGHPGAGKSLLMKVLAGWLPEHSYTVIRVPLRWVDASAPVHEQIKQAVSAETHERVSWNTLTEESRDAARVVLLDGLDELMQATGVSQSNYLDAVVEFQEREANLGFPVAVIVTSRTVVADRTRIPNGCLLVRLDEFTLDQVSYWLRAWNTANRAGQERGTFRPLTQQSAMRHANLAVHPLLLLMLALYTADPAAPDPGDEVLSESTLYGRLLDNFVRRELAKRQPSAQHVAEKELAEQLWRLGLTAFGMFNRGRQFITDKELDRDFEELLGRAEEQERQANFDATLTLAQKMIGQFFFVHSAQARGPDRLNSTYEFLHPTFGEYLIAATTMDLLQEIIKQRAASPRTPLETASSALRQLLSHQTFATRPPIVTFVREIVAALPADKNHLASLLSELIAQSLHGPLARSDRYNPSGADAVQRLAAYNANLVLLAIATRGKLMLEDAAPPGYPPTQWRRSIIRLWQAGLGDAGWQATTSYLTAGHWQGSLLPRPSLDRPGQPAGAGLTPMEVAELELIGDGSRYETLSAGLTVNRVLGSAGPSIGLLRFLLGARVGEGDYQAVRSALRDWSLPADTTKLIVRRLATDAAHLPYEVVEPLVGACLRRLGTNTADAQVATDLARILVAHNELLADQPTVWRHLGRGMTAQLLITAAVLTHTDERLDSIEDLLDYAREVLRSLPIHPAADPDPWASLSGEPPPFPPAATEPPRPGGAR